MSPPIAGCAKAPMLFEATCRRAARSVLREAHQREEAVLAHEFLVLALDCDEPAVLEIEIAVMTPAASDIAAIYELSTGMPCRFRIVDMGWKTPRR